MQLEQPSSIDLEALDLDPAPIFVIRVSTTALKFDILYANQAFSISKLRDAILADDRDALLFRSWAQALGPDRTPQSGFSGWTWSAELAKGGALKTIRAAEPITRQRSSKEDNKLDDMFKPPAETLLPIWPTIGQNRSSSFQGSNTLRNLPRTNLSARWKGIQAMMEMSDVGVFEYNTAGKLLHGNEAWYKLSSHPRDPVAAAEFSFMDLVHPEDKDLVMAQWNTIAQGSPVTFEMRWKPRPGTDDTAQWVLSACVPIFDDDKTLISIAGNTIDINAQKKSQEATQLRLEALEQARISELKFARFAQLSPTAIYIFVPGVVRAREIFVSQLGSLKVLAHQKLLRDSQLDMELDLAFYVSSAGNTDRVTGMQFVNDRFYELTNLSQRPADQFEWFSIIADEDVERVQAHWAEMLEAKRPDDLQFRLKKTWLNQEGVHSNIWLQSSNHAELDEHGNVLSVMGTLFDISHFKWADSVQRQRVEEVLEAKRQQENFIDMTSHELRNPLSAIVQCAESAITTLQHITTKQVPSPLTDNDARVFDEEISSCLDAIQTIVSCSAHAKRIIDDVLTLSKLDSNLILITPVRVQPTVVVHNAIKMFMIECQQNGITLEFQKDASIEEFGWIRLDPSRLLQILINLLTNAIKFTKDRPVKKITVELGASWARPTAAWHSIVFSSDDEPEIDLLNQAGWGIGARAHLWVKVTDTGCGMAEHEQKDLFTRFKQASPRTHIKYGGSGLGLFISKSLATLQGGAIGVHSETGIGSTFAFFVGTRVAEPPTIRKTGPAIEGKALVHRGMTLLDEMKAVKVNVLIVEDNLINQTVLKRQLQKCGWDVSVAGNGQEALDWLRESVYWRGERDAGKEHNTHDDTRDTPPMEPQKELDIILLDVEMPIMDGLTCARQIRELEDRGLLAPPPAQVPNLRSPRIPILAISANVRMEQIQRTLAAGMDDAVTKPFAIKDLWPKMTGLIPRLAAAEEEMVGQE